MMKALKYISMALLLAVGMAACGSAEQEGDVEATGVVQGKMFTTFQYGTHLLNMGDTAIYALKSETVNLDEYIDQEITIVGKKIDGYPVDGGPDYIEVTKVKK